MLRLMLMTITGDIDMVTAPELVRTSVKDAEESFSYSMTD